MNVELIKPYGYCFGVKRAIDYVLEIREKEKQDVYCIGQIVHNKIVNDYIESKNIKVTIDDRNKAIDEISEGVVIFSAHGTDEKIIQKAKDKGLIVYDAICPFVKKSFEVIKNHQDYDIIYIGKKNHPESNAAISLSEKIHLITSVNDVKDLTIKNDKIAVINQTTLSILDIKDIYDEIIAKYPFALIVDEICSATRTRQERLINLDSKYDGVIVIGDKNSNNTKSLLEIASKRFDAIIIDNIDALDRKWLEGKENIAIFSGASTPNAIVEEVYATLIK